MGQLSKWTSFAALALVIYTNGHASGADPVESSVYRTSHKTKALGKNLGATLTTGTPSGSSTLENVTTLSLLGSSLQALSGNIDIPNTPDASSNLEFYSFGKRIFNESFFSSNNGLLGGEVGLTPTEVRVPVVSYPIGPLLLEIDGGVRFQADLQGHIMPSLIMGPSGISNLSTIEATLTGNAQGAGFLEGYAKLFVVRGGLAGELDLINAQANASAIFYFDGGGPVTNISAMAQFVSGDVYAFLDYFNIFAWSWSNIWTDTLYRWNGVCFSTGNMTCP